jgi:hypothetical protein
MVRFTLLYRFHYCLLAVTETATHYRFQYGLSAVTLTATHYRFQYGLSAVTVTATITVFSTVCQQSL